MDKGVTRKITSGGFCQNLLGKNSKNTSLYKFNLAKTNREKF